MVSSWWEYEALPFTVLDDCRLLMEADATAHKMKKGGKR